MNTGAVSPTPEEAAALERLRRWESPLYGPGHDARVKVGDVRALVAALRDARREVAEMEWRRDWQYDKAVAWRNRAAEAERERDQAREALERIVRLDGNPPDVPAWTRAGQIARAALGGAAEQRKEDDSGNQ